MSGQGYHKGAWIGFWGAILGSIPGALITGMFFLLANNKGIAEPIPNPAPITLSPQQHVHVEVIHPGGRLDLTKAASSTEVINPGVHVEPPKNDPPISMAELTQRIAEVTQRVADLRLKTSLMETNHHSAMVK